MAEAVFIYGILQRSGTNLLNQLLLRVPNFVQAGSKVREDWFVHFSDSLYSYTDDLLKRWDVPDWGGRPIVKEDLYASIGEGLLSFLSRSVPHFSDRHVIVSKTPGVQSIERHFELFPSSKLLLIVRDPRDVAASAFKTWGRPVSQTIADWNNGFISISSFEKIASSGQYCLLRYEDLVADVQSALRQCFEVLQVDEGVYPWAELDDLPVYGSSEEGEHWKMKAASHAFKPIGRWRDLPEEQQELFEGVDKRGLDYFGYSLDRPGQLPNREARVSMVGSSKISQRGV